jgi:hypothetical protein
MQFVSEYNHVFKMTKIHGGQTIVQTIQKVDWGLMTAKALIAALKDIGQNVGRGI